MTHTDFFYSCEKYHKILPLTVREILQLNIVFFATETNILINSLYEDGLSSCVFYFVSDLPSVNKNTFLLVGLFNEAINYHIM